MFGLPYMQTNSLGIVKNPARAYAALTLVTACWAANTVLAKLAVGNISPMAVVTLRWLMVLLFLSVIARESVRKDWPVLRRHLGLLGALGALGFTAFNSLFYYAAHTTTALNMGILQGTMPAFVLLGVFVAYRTPIGWRQMLGVGITLVAVTVVASEGSLQRLAAFAFKQGDVLLIFACVLYSGYTVWLRRRPAVDAISQFAVMAAAAFLASLPLAGIEIATGNFQAPTAQGWLLVLLIAIFPSLLAQVFFIRGVEIIGPARAGVFVNLSPILAAFFAVVFLGESIAGYHAAALALVLGGIWLSEASG